MPLIKGWRLNPEWISLIESRNSREESLKLEKQIHERVKHTADVNDELLRINKQRQAEAREHMARCHAEKIAAGEIKPDSLQ